jgi:hypothetical protein
MSRIGFGPGGRWLISKRRLRGRRDSQGGDGDMSNQFTSELLAALNASVEFKDSGWNEVEEVLRGQSKSTSSSQSSENRFAATICFGMSKVRQYL